MEVVERKAIILWVGEEDVGSLKIAKSMLDLAESTIRAKLGDDWEVEPIKGSSLKEFSNSLSFRIQFELARADSDYPRSEEIVDLVQLELGKTSNGSAVKLSLRDLCHHVAILGRTGSGKTTTSKFIVSKVWEFGVPVLVFDYENEYRDLIILLGGRIVSPFISTFPASINVLDGLKGEDETYLDEIVEKFTIILGLTPPQSYLMLKGLQNLRKPALEGKSPTLLELYEEIASHSARIGQSRRAKGLC